MGDIDWLIRPIAHRGLHDASRGLIENTIPAVEAAIARGYGVEIDVRPAKGGEPVVFHDAALNRLTTATGSVAAMTPDALRGVAMRGTDARIPTLDELLTQVAGRAPMLVEIKSDWSGDGAFATRVAEIMRAHRGHVAAMSFDPALMSAFASAAPKLPRGLVAERFDNANYWSKLGAVRRFSLRNLLSAARVRPHFIAYDIRALPAFAPEFGRRAFGWKILTWTVRTEAERARAARFADAMIFEGFLPELQ